MTPKLLLRIAAGLVLFFAFGHTIGHTTRHDVNIAQRNVLEIMAESEFEFFGNITSYDGMYNGLSLNLIFTLIAFALVLWFVSNITNEKPKLAMHIVIPIALCLFGFAVTSFLYFFLVPAITCFLASVALVVATINLNKATV